MDSNADGMVELDEWIAAPLIRPLKANLMLTNKSPDRYTSSLSKFDKDHGDGHSKIHFLPGSFNLSSSKQ